MKKYPYLLIVTQDSFLSEDTINIMQQAEVIHILAPQLYNYDNILDFKKIAMYTFNKIQFEITIKNHWTPHISLFGLDIFNKELISLAREDDEIFWFPEAVQLTDNMTEFTTYLSTLNKAICLNYNPYIQNNIESETFRLFVQKIHANFSNPLYEKEKFLTTTTEDNNHIVIQKEHATVLSPVVMGLFGDYPIGSNFQVKNIKGILRNKECKLCDFQQPCIDRGLGYIMEELNYKGCIGIKLMTNH